MAPPDGLWEDVCKELGMTPVPVLTPSTRSTKKRWYYIAAAVLLALAGFFLYGPQALLGVVASNEVSKKAASSAVGIIGFMSYLSTLITGYPLGKFADTYGWHPIFILMAGVSVIGFILIVTLWNLKDRSRNIETQEA